MNGHRGELLKLLKKHPSRVLEKSNIFCEEDIEIRYFKDMWAFMDSGVKAEIIKVEHEDDEEDTGKDFVNHGEVMVALKSVLIRENKGQSDLIVEVVDAMITKIEMIKSQEESKRLRSIEFEKKQRERRQNSLKKRCIRDEEFFCTVNILKLYVTGVMFLKEQDPRSVMLASILTSISFFI